MIINSKFAAKMLKRSETICSITRTLWINFYSEKSKQKTSMNFFINKSEACEVQNLLKFLCVAPNS